MTINLSDKKFLIEWNKIKDYNIFSSIEAFANLYFDNPNGKCFRKYTSYPWSKENFFFGSYDDLLSFQKTTNEIPFYLSKKIGTKVNNLKIQSFFRDHKRTLCVNCICDCGKETIKTYDSLLRGNARTCGCNKGKGSPQRTINLKQLFPKIIESYWDYDKNTLSPTDIPLNIDDEYWWKGYGRSYKMPLRHLMQSSTGTSFPEQTIRFFLQKNGIDVINRHYISFGMRKYEIDLFLPKYNIGIEYDGVFWHNSKQALEQKKNQIFEKLNIKFIRIREFGLSTTGITNGTEILMEGPASHDTLANCINSLFLYLQSTLGLKLNQVSNTDIKANEKHIRNQYHFSYQENNILNSWLYEYWSNQNSIEPYFVPIDSSDKYYFECKYGAKFFCSPKYLAFKHRHTCYDFNFQCFFDEAILCQRAQKIEKELSLKILDSILTNKGKCKFSFQIINNSNSSFQPLDLNYCIISTPEKFYSLEKNLWKIKDFSTISSSPQEMKCNPSYDCKLNQELDCKPFSKYNYSLVFNIPIIDQKETNILISFALLDQQNWVYTICFNINKSNHTTFTYGRIYTWEVYQSLISNKKLSFRHQPNEDEMKKIINDLTTKKFT